MTKVLLCMLTGLYLPLAAAEPEKPTSWAVVVSGINKDPDDQQEKNQAVEQLTSCLSKKLKVPKDQQFILVSKDSANYQQGMMDSSLETIEITLKQVAESIRPEDTFFFYYVGLANIVKEHLRLNLPGPDMLHQTLAKHLNAIQCKRSLIILDCPCSGYAIESLTQPNRIIITGAQSDQPWSTQLSQYFVPAISQKDSDYDNDGKVSVLEAFRYASMQLDSYYLENDQIKTENPLLEDDGDGIPSQQPWTFTESRKDGKYASEWILWELK